MEAMKIASWLPFHFRRFGARITLACYRLSCIWFSWHHDIHAVLFEVLKDNLILAIPSAVPNLLTYLVYGQKAYLSGVDSAVLIPRPCPRISSLHPAAPPAGVDHLFLSAVPVAFYLRLRDLVVSLDAYRSIKLDFTRRYSQATGKASTHGRLVITMPGTIHEELKWLAADTITLQITQKGFLPPRR